MGLSPRGSRIAVVAALAVVALLALAGSASARTVPLYTFTGDFYDGSGSTAGTVAQATDVDVNQSTGNGFITDTARLGGSFSQFDADGDPVAFSALEGATSISLKVDGAYRIAVDNSGTATQGNIYVLTEKIVKGYRPDGTELGGNFPIGGLRAPCSLAVDTQGEVWGVDYRRSLIVEYTANGDPTGAAVSFPPVIEGLQNGACDLAIDSQDNFYLAAAGFKEGGTFYAKKFDSAGNYLYDFAGGQTQSVAVDRETDHVFALQPSPFANGEYDMEVVEYDENGDRVTSFGAPDPAHSFGGLSAATGVAVNQQTHAIYVTNGRDYGGEQHVEIFSPGEQALVPTVRTIRPGLTPTSATLKGTVDLDGGGATTDCYFEWGTNYLYGNILPCTPASPITGPGPHEVTAEVAGPLAGRALPLPARRQERQRDPRLRQRPRLPAPGPRRHLGGCWSAKSTPTERWSPRRSTPTAAKPPTGSSTGPRHATSAAAQACRCGSRHCSKCWERRGYRSCSPASKRARPTTSASSPPTTPAKSRGPKTPSSPTPWTPRSTSAPTRRCAKKWAPCCCPTAAPTSWSRPPTPAATTSAPTWSRGRSRSSPGRAPWTASSTR